MSAPLAGRRVVTTRDRPGGLDDRLRSEGAEVVHVPLIEIVGVDDPSLDAALEQLDAVDWLVVTSRHGAHRVAGALARHRAGGGSPVRTAAVGTATAAVLTDAGGADVDLIAPVQTAAGLVRVFPTEPARVLVAQADRAEPTLVDGLRALGHHVEVHTAYATRLRRPSPEERQAALAADAVAFASGSAAIAWADAFGPTTPPVVAVIGPTTARVAAEHGLQVTGVATEHSVDGLAALVVDLLKR